MKRKLLTFLMAIFMIVPLAGCGETNLDVDPQKDEAKVMIYFSEFNNGSHVINQSSLKSRYSDCAEVSGAGFYKEDQTATIMINYNKNACSFLGWAKLNGTKVENLTGSTSYSYAYRVTAEDLGKTVNLYAVMGPKTGGESLNVSSTTFGIRGITVVDYTYENLYEIESGVLTIHDNGEIKYTYDAANKKFTKVGGGESATILVDDTVALNGRTYTVIREGSSIKGVAAGSSAKRYKDIDPDALDDYKFVGSGADGNGVTFKTFVDNNLKGTKTQGLTLQSLAENSNLSYYIYTDPSTHDEELKYYKITWKYASGSCDNTSLVPKTIFDPKVQKFNDTEICLAAEIDLTTGITNTFLTDAVKSTLYSQAYIYNQDYVNPASPAPSCKSATHATAEVSESCMFVRNIGALTDEEKNDLTSLKETQTQYYALNKNAVGDVVIEGIEPYFSSLTYVTNVYESAAPKSKYIEYTDKSIAYMEKFNMKLEPIYKKLKGALTNPATALSDITYKYSSLTNSVVVDTVKVDGDTYYFNYVQDGSQIGDFYSPDKDLIADLPYKISAVGKDKGNLYDINFTYPSGVDHDEFETLKTLLNLSPYNLIAVNSTAIQTDIKDLLFRLTNEVELPYSAEGINLEDLNALKKYEFTVVANASAKKLDITATNKLIDITNFNDNPYGYDSSRKIYKPIYTAGSTAFDSSYCTDTTSHYNTLLCRINYLVNAQNLIDNEDWIKITSGSGYVEYAFYNKNRVSELLYKVRYYQADKRFVVLNRQTDAITDFTFNFTKPVPAGNGNLGVVDKITNNDGLELTANISYKIYSNQINHNVYVSDVEALKGYLIDINNLMVYTPTRANASLMANYDSDLKYYFIQGSIYYGIYEETEEVFTVHNITINSDRTVEKGDKVADLSLGKAAPIDGIYYRILGEERNYKVQIDKDGEPMSLRYKEDDDAYVLNITGITLKYEGINVSNMESKDIYKLYNEVLRGNTEDFIVLDINGTTRYILEIGNVVYELESNGTSIYTILYNGQRYNVTFKLKES